MEVREEAMTIRREAQQDQVPGKADGQRDSAPLSALLGVGTPCSVEPSASERLCFFAFTL